MQIFNSRILQRHAERAKRISGKAPFLWQRIADELQERLRDIRRDLLDAAEIGPEQLVFNPDLRAEKNIAQVDYHSPFAPDEILAIPPQSQDAVVAWGFLHWINDLPGMLIQCRHALRPDGVFLGALFGGETLHELRDSIAQVELKHTGGISPRISPFASIQDMAALMQRTQFALPVVDHDLVTITYPDLPSLIADLRTMGQTNAIAKHNPKIPARQFWRDVEDYYRMHHGENGRLLVTVEILYLIGWAPHDSQQRPSKRGSATHRLADVLQTEEKGSGDFI